MKTFVVPVLFSALAFGQAPVPPQVVPGTPAPAAPAPQAPTAPPIAPDTVVLEANGRKYTAAEIDKIIAALPPQIQQNARM